MDYWAKQWANNLCSGITFGDEDKTVYYLFREVDFLCVNNECGSFCQ